MEILVVAVILLATVCLHGYSLVLVKLFKNTDSYQINYFQGLVFVVVDAVLFPYGVNNDQYHNPSVVEIFYAMIFMGIPITVGLIAFGSALLWTNKYGKLTPFMFVSIIFGYVVSVFRYGESVNVVCLLGTVAIVVGIVFNAREK